MPIKIRDSRKSWERLLRYYLKPKRPPRDEGSGLAEPIAPRPPMPLSGGAAASLEFDD